MDAREEEYVRNQALPCACCGEKPRAEWQGLGWMVACGCEQPAGIGRTLASAVRDWNTARELETDR